MTEPLLSLDAATLHAGRAAGHLSNIDPAAVGDERMCDLNAQVATAMSLSAIATFLGSMADGSSDSAAGTVDDGSWAAARRRWEGETTR